MTARTSSEPCWHRRRRRLVGAIFTRLARASQLAPTPPQSAGQPVSQSSRQAGKQAEEPGPPYRLALSLNNGATLWYLSSCWLAGWPPYRPFIWELAAAGPNIRPPLRLCANPICFQAWPTTPLHCRMLIARARGPGALRGIQRVVCVRAGFGKGKNDSVPASRVSYCCPARSFAPPSRGLLRWLPKHCCCRWRYLGRPKPSLTLIPMHEHTHGHK